MTRFATHLFGVFLTAVFLFSGCSDKAEKTTAPAKPIVIAVDNNFPPMAYTNENNEYVGYEIDLAREVGIRLNREIVFFPLVEFNRKEEILNSGEVDCIWDSIAITPERAKHILFTPPYMEGFQVLLVMADGPYKTAADLKGQKVGAQAGTVGIAIARTDEQWASHFSEVVEYVAHSDAIAALENGDVAALMMDSLFASDRVSYNKNAFRILNEIVSVDKYGIGFRHSDTALRDDVWNTLKAMQADGTVRQISHKWFGQDLSIIK